MIYRTTAPSLPGERFGGTAGCTLILVLQLALFGLCAAPAAAQKTSVTASVNTTTIETGETLTYTIQIAGSSTPSVATPAPPEVEGLELVRSRPRTSRNISVVNGRIHQQISFEWTLRATGAGQASIGSTIVDIEKSEHATDPITITVVNQTTANSSSQARSGPPQHRQEDVFIRTRSSDTEVYANEQITVEYMLYFREGFQIQNSRLADSWKADGLWREELKVDQNPLPETQVIDGIRYNTITLKRSAFFPTRTGSLRIDPLRIETEVLRPYRRNDPFNFRVPRDERLYSATIASPPVDLAARSLPDDAPSSFSGAVGSFTLDHEITPTTVPAGEAIDLTITVSGRGNISTLGRPIVQVPSSIDIYDPQVSHTIDREDRFLHGRKTFSYTLVPREPGRFELPPIEWSYFDPDKERFVTRQTASLTLEVEPTAASSPTAENQNPVGDDIAGLMTVPPSFTTNSRPLHRQIWPYAGVAGPAAALLLLLGFRRWKQRQNEYKARPNQRARSAARHHLTRAEEFRRREQVQAFYDAIERSIRGFIGLRLDIPAQGLTEQQLHTHLERANVPPDVCTTVREILRSCQQARFSPALPNSRDMDATYDQTTECLSRLENLLDDAHHTSRT